MGWAIVAALFGVAGVQAFIHIGAGVNTPFLVFLVPALLLAGLLLMVARVRGATVKAIKDGRGGVARLESTRVIRETGDPDDTLIEQGWTVSLDNGLFYRHTTRYTTLMNTQDKLRLVVQPNRESPNFVAQSDTGAGGERIRIREARLRGVTDVPEWPGTRVPRLTHLDDPYRTDDPWAPTTGGAGGANPRPDDIPEWAASQDRDPGAFVRTLVLVPLFLVAGVAGAWWLAKENVAVAVDNVTGGGFLPTLSPSDSETDTDPTTDTQGAPGGTSGSEESTDELEPEEIEPEEAEPEELAEAIPQLAPMTAADLPTVLAHFEEMAGTNETTSVGLYPEHANAKMPIESGSDKFDSYGYHPYTGFTHNGPAAAQPRPDSDGRFTFDEIDPEVVARVVESAPEVSGFTDETVSHVIISRLMWAVAPGQTTIRVYIGDDYSSALLWYDTDGNLLRHSR